MNILPIYFVLLFTSCSFLFSPAVSKAQSVPSYLFLEVADSNQKPIPEAKVEIMPIESGRVAMTDENGQMRSYLPIRSSDFTFSLFKVSKSGYFSYQDLGTPTKAGELTLLKLELLKIPQTKEEKRALGKEQSKREFMTAAKNGDASGVRRLLKSGIDPNLKTGELRGVPLRISIPAILLAAASGNTETVKTLLKAGAKVTREDDLMRDILFYYFQTRFRYVTEKERRVDRREFEDGALRLIKAGAETGNLRDIDQTALMLAAQTGSLAVAEYLIDKKSPLDAVDRNGQTALTYAIYSLSESKPVQYEMVDLLLKAGAEVKLQNENILQAVAQSSDAEILRKLTGKDLFRNETDYAGMTAMMYLINKMNYRGAFIAEAVRILLAAGADPNISVPANNGTAARYTALILAASNGDLATMRALIAGRADVNYSYGEGYSALSAAASGGGDRVASVKLLIESGADVKGQQGSIALKTARSSSGRQADRDLVELLIAAGAK